MLVGELGDGERGLGGGTGGLGLEWGWGGGWIGLDWVGARGEGDLRAGFVAGCVVADGRLRVEV